jgi:hypothetical protein
MYIRTFTNQRHEQACSGSSRFSNFKLPSPLYCRRCTVAACLALVFEALQQTKACSSATCAWPARLRGQLDRAQMHRCLVMPRIACNFT